MSTEVLCKITHNAWGSGLLKELNILRESSLMCDVKILLSGGIQTTAHSCVLSAASPFFKSLLVQIENPEIDMSSFPSEVIQQILTFIYTGETLFRMADLFIAHKVAAMFNITVLIALIQDMVLHDKTVVDDDNIVAMAEGDTWNEELCDIVPTSVVNDLKLEEVNQTQLLQVGAYNNEDCDLGDTIAQDPNSDMMQANLENIPTIMMKTSEFDEMTEASGPHRLSSSGQEIESFVSSVLDSLGNVVHLLDPKIEKDKSRPRKAYSKEKPLKVYNKEVADDGSVPDRALQTLPVELFIQQSVHADADSGVYTSVGLPRGSTLGPYAGNIIKDKDIINQVNPRYCWTIYNKGMLVHWLNGEDESCANWMRYVQIVDRSKANLRTFQNDGKLFFEVLRRISPNEELLVTNTFIRPNDGITCKTAEELRETTELSLNPDSTQNAPQDGATKEIVSHKDSTESMEENNDEESGFPCDACDIIFLVEDMYHRHMHAIHSLPLPLDIYMNNKHDKLMREVMKIAKKDFSVSSEDAVVEEAHSIKDQSDVSDVRWKSDALMDNSTDFMDVTRDPKHKIVLQHESADVQDNGLDVPDHDADVLCQSADVQNNDTELKGDLEMSLVTRRSPRIRRRSRRLRDYESPSLTLGQSLQQDANTSKNQKCTPEPKKTKNQKRMLKRSKSAKDSTSPHGTDTYVDLLDEDKTLTIKTEVIDLPKTTSIKKQHVCTFCEKSFKLEPSLIRHQRLHTADESSQIKCDKCNKYFTHLGNLKIHMRTHTGEKPYKCEICERGFSQKGNLALHMSRHRGENNHTCDQCGKSYNDSSYLLKHIRIQHEGTGGEQCPVCQKMLHDKPSLRRHLVTHTNKKLYKCSQCGKGFNQYANLKSHKLIHTGEKPFACQECVLCFRTKHELKVHSVCHHKLKVYTCAVCGKQFGYLASYAKHERCGCKYKFQNDERVKGNEPISEEDRFYCQHCSIVFSNAMLLEEHTRSHFFHCTTCDRLFTQQVHFNAHVERHDGVKEFACHICPKAFHSARDLKQHKRTHNERQHVCSICQHSCLTASVLKQHMYIHTGEKPHVCGLCNMPFRMRHQLKRHMRTHDPNSMKPVAKLPRPICPQCGRSFYDKQALRKHERLHTGIKPYSCQFCSKHFATRGAMRIHESGHMGDKRYKCPMCMKAFRANRDYLLHMVTHDPEKSKPHQCTICDQVFSYKKGLRNHLKSHA